MTAPLLTPERLTTLLTGYASGVGPGELAPDFGLHRTQVSTLIRTHRHKLKAIQKRLGSEAAKRKRRPPKPIKPLPGIFRKCLRCPRSFWTDNKFIRICDSCKGTEAWKGGQPVHMVGLRGVG